MCLFVSINNVLLHLYSSLENYVRTDCACLIYLGYENSFLQHLNLLTIYSDQFYTIRAEAYKKFLMPIANGELSKFIQQLKKNSHSLEYSKLFSKKFYLTLKRNISFPILPGMT